MYLFFYGLFQRFVTEEPTTIIYAEGITEETKDGKY